MRRHTGAFLVLVLTLASAGPARAQQPAPSPSPAPTPPAPDRPVLELSLEEAVTRAMENNVDIAVERYNPEASAQSVREIQGSYDPFLFSNVNQNSRITPASSAFTGGAKVDTDTTTYNLGGTQLFKTGGIFRLEFDNTRSVTNNVFTLFNPSFGATLTASLTQPLLRDFRIDTTRQQLKVARKNREISEERFRQTVVNTRANVKQLYYDLLYAIDNLEVQKKSRDLASRLLEENRIKVRVGTLAPLDVVAAESEVASREEGVIVAENDVAEAEDAVKRAIFAQNDPEVWALRIVPTDRPSAEPIAIDAPLAVKTALQQRTDILSARKNVESADISVQYLRNQTLPTLDLVAAYGATGIGGTQLVRQGFGGPIIQQIQGGYGGAVSDVFSNTYPTWTLGVNISYPVGNRSAGAAAARAQVTRDQAEANVRALELQIATEVRSAARAVETNLKRIDSTRAARTLQDRRLDAEMKRFAAGMSTNFLVTQAQRDLAVAEVAELRAIADYRKSVVNFERVQEAGLTSGGTGAAAVSSVLTSTPITGSRTGTPTATTQQQQP
jgi:outer membrane protein